MNLTLRGNIGTVESLLEVLLDAAGIRAPSAFCARAGQSWSILRNGVREYAQWKSTRSPDGCRGRGRDPHDVPACSGGCAALLEGLLDAAGIRAPSAFCARAGQSWSILRNGVREYAQWKSTRSPDGCRGRPRGFPLG